MRPKPRLESFASLECYLEALVEWHLDRRFAAADCEWLRQVGIGWEDEA
jgi:hypothetical protein